MFGHFKIIRHLYRVQRSQPEAARFATVPDVDTNTFLGNGAYGAVFEVEDQEGGVHYALKVPVPDAVQGTDLDTQIVRGDNLPDMVREAAIYPAVNNLHNDKIVIYIGKFLLWDDHTDACTVGTNAQNGKLFKDNGQSLKWVASGANVVCDKPQAIRAVVMELCDGGNVQDNYHPTRDQLEGVVTALAALHTADICQKDLHRGNVFMCGDDLKIADFGQGRASADCGKSIDVRSLRDNLLNQALLVTPPYEVLGGMYDLPLIWNLKGFMRPQLDNTAILPVQLLQKLNQVNNDARMTAVAIRDCITMPDIAEFVCKVAAKGDANTLKKRRCRVRGMWLQWSKDWGLINAIKPGWKDHFLEIKTVASTNPVDANCIIVTGTFLEVSRGIARTNDHSRKICAAPPGTMAGLRVTFEQRTPCV
jgi:hypothetical protein